MTATETRQWIRYSFNDWLKTTFPGVYFNFGDRRSDIDAMLATNSPIVLIDWLKRSMTPLNGVNKVVWPVQLSVIAKFATDPYGGDVDNVISQITSLLKKTRIPLYDYTNPSSPVDTGYRLTAVNLSDDDVQDDVIRVVAITAELLYFEH